MYKRQRLGCAFLDAGVKVQVSGIDGTHMDEIAHFPMATAVMSRIRQDVYKRQGYRYVLTAMWPAVGATDFPSTCTKFQVPYFIFDGVLDQNTPAALVQDYFDLIQAPKKELIWFCLLYTSRCV